ECVVSPTTQLTRHLAWFCSCHYPNVWRIVNQRASLVTPSPAVDGRPGDDVRMHDASQMTWEQCYQAARVATTHGELAQPLRHARTLFARAHRDQDAWVWHAASDPERRRFLQRVLAPGMPKRFLRPMVRAAIYTLDASAPKGF